MLTTQPLPGNFGVAVRGVDLIAGAADRTMRALTQALYAHRVIVLKDQSLDRDSYLAFGRRWGTPIPHVLDHMRMPGYPDLLVVGNTEKKDKAVEIRNGTALWHTDQSYEAVPASTTMLYSIKTPRVGGETQFCDMVAAYEGLPADVKARIDGLEVAHSYGAGRRQADELLVNPIINTEQRNHVPPTYHRMALRHPVTGHKALYAMGHGAHGIKGMAEADALDLIAEMKRHAVQDAYRYDHKYEVGDLAIWDTFSTMHSGKPIDYATTEDTARLLWRISVRGMPDVCRAAA